MPIVNKPLREQYRSHKPGCELARWIGCCNGHGNGLQVHHITGGTGSRHDIWPNLLLICDEVHRWIHAHPIEGRILCWLVKKHQGEFDVEHIRRAWGQCPLAWVEKKAHESRDSRCLGWADELLDS